MPDQLLRRFPAQDFPPRPSVGAERGSVTAPRSPSPFPHRAAPEPLLLTLSASASPHGAECEECAPARGRRTRKTLPCCSDVTRRVLNAAPQGRA